ncbi:tellurite resistance/C4-dicarboxylate transporter family protein [Microbacterium sp.]|uniref:tellurite resistance/C4-dicarboxylate transporter family protein n=1 Tax=Microbacterium sp. TaxID=51671 RepID=UPI003F95B93D
MTATTRSDTHVWSPATLTPGYFAGVMGTGIVSIGAWFLGFEMLSLVLLWIALIFYVILLVLNVWRIIAHRTEVLADLHASDRGFGYFTFIAATCVISTTLLNTHFDTVAVVLLGVSIVAWLVLGYIIPWFAMLGGGRHATLQDANGTWFIWVVASQSIAVVASGLGSAEPDFQDALAIISVMAWGVGIALYVACAIFVTLRVMLYGVKPIDLTPSYWVMMGALAITVVAGSRIIEMHDAPMIVVTKSLIAGLSVFFWSFATWLIPILIAAGIWRHWYHRVPLRYEPGLWSMVFPVGMYGVASISLGRADSLPLVEAVGHAWFWVSLAAWTIVFVAMMVQVIRRFTRR